MDGLLLIHKEADGTSHDVVQRARRILRQKQIGHCGTLDPAATGLLLLTVGQATRLTRFLIRAPKAYDGDIRFGATTDTYDAGGEVTATASTQGLTGEQIAAAMSRFVGRIDHTPPPYSAKKVQGRKLYELARRGEEIEIESKEVEVYEFSPEGEFRDDTLGFRLRCESGTYARTLAHELGKALGCGAHLSRLRRQQIGPFELADAITLGDLKARQEADPDFLQHLGAAWIPFDRIPLPFGTVTADAQQEQRLLHGQTVLVRELSGQLGDWVRLLNRRDEMIAVGTIAERIGDRGVGLVQPRVVFTPRAVLPYRP